MSTRIDPLVLKVFISALLIVFLIYSIDLAQFMIALRNISFVALISSSLFYLFTYVIVTFRWYFLLRGVGIKVSFLRSFEYYVIGFFFSNFLPTGIGGDLVRIYLLSKETKNASTITSSVILERLLGFGATLLIALVLSPFAHIKARFVLVLAVLNLFFFGIIFASLNQWAQSAFRKVLSILPSKKIRDFLVSTLESLYLFRHRLIAVTLCFFFSLLYQTGLIYFYFMVGRTLGVRISFVDYLTYLPLVWVVSLLPISLNAIGIREAGFSFFFGELGESPSLGFLNSLIGFVITVVVSLIGGIAFVLRREKKIASFES